jgi:tetratricopeptide (TPR) repeat protein
MRLREAAALLLLSAAAPPAGAAQPPALCEGHACTSADLWAGVNDLHQLKVAFVEALRRFAEAASGSYGDEGSSLASTLDDARRALRSWDQEIITYESRARTASATADARAALGAVYLDRARDRDALTELTAALRVDPRRADVHELAAMAYELGGDSANAVASLEKAVVIAPQNLATLYRIARAVAGDSSRRAVDAQRRVDAVHLSLAGDTSVQFDRIGLLRQTSGVAPIFPPARYVAAFQDIERGRYAEGLAALRAAADGDPLVMHATTDAAPTAGARLRRGQLQAALSELRAVAETPDPETRRVAGVAFWADEQYEKSIEAFTAAVQVRPRDERARIALADVFAAAGKRAEAQQTLTETIAILPESGQAHYRMARLYQSQSLVSRAIEELERAASCSPLVGLDALYETLGGLYATQADFDRASAAYRKRIDVNPNNDEAHRKLGEIYALQGHDDAALAEFAIAERLNRNGAETFAEAAQAYLRANRFADAVRVAQRALALDPANQKARFSLGTSLVRLGRTDEGRRELDFFQREIDDAADARRRVLEANTLERDAARAEGAGDFATAVSLLQRAVDVSPEHARLELDLGRMLVKAGRPGDALPHLAKANESDDRAEIHEIAAEAYEALGQADARAREETRFRQLVEQRKEERLKTRPLLQ